MRPHGVPARFRPPDRHRAQPALAAAPREPVRPRVGGGRDLAGHARRLGPLVLRPQGRGGGDRLRDVQGAGPVPRLPARERAEGRGPRARDGLRAPRRLPARGGADAARGAGRAVRGVREAEGPARGGGPLRRGAQEGAARRPARHRHRDLARRRRAARHPRHARPARAHGPRDPLPHARAGRGRRAADRAGHRGRQCPARMRRAHRRARRRQPRGPVGVQRGGRRPRHRGLGDPGRERRRATRPISRSPTSWRTCARPRPPRPRRRPARTARRCCCSLGARAIALRGRPHGR